jgi:hypothetical protein
MAEDLQGRQLGGYLFLPSTRVGDPFVTTHFRNSTGLGLAMNVELPLLIIESEAGNDTLLSLNGNTLFVLLDFEYHYAATKRVAFRFAGTGASRVGTGAEAILTQGVTAQAGFNAGTTFLLWNNDRVAVSGVADLNIGNVLRIDLVRFLEDLADFGPRAASLVQQDDGAVMGAGVCAAWALSSWAGIHGSLEGGYRNTLRSSEGGVTLDVAGSMDFAQRGGTPLGMIFRFDLDTLRIAGDNVGTTLGAGIELLYTGREEFLLGIDLGWQRTPLTEPKVTLNGTQFALTARYYF